MNILRFGPRTKPTIYLFKNFETKKWTASNSKKHFWIYDLLYSDREKIRELIQTIEDGDKHSQIQDFCYSSKSIVFYDVINTLFFVVEGHEFEENESELRSFIQEYYFPTYVDYI